MSERARKRLRTLGFSVLESAELAADLLASHDDEPAAEVEAAWIIDLTRRVREARANPEAGIHWESVRTELYADLVRE
jgi:Putative addiction module component